MKLRIKEKGRRQKAEVRDEEGVAEVFSSLDV